MTRVGEIERECREQPALYQGLECPQRIPSYRSRLSIRQREIARGRNTLRPLAISLCLIERHLLSFQTGYGRCFFRFVRPAHVPCERTPRASVSARQSNW